jgi:hypothetical protein
MSMLGRGALAADRARGVANIMARIESIIDWKLLRPNIFMT